MKYKLVFLLLIAFITANAQNPVRQYKKSVKAQRAALFEELQGRSPTAQTIEFDRLAKEGEALIKQGYDIVLPPIESINFAASFSDVNAGSWGETHLGINRRYKDIYDRAQRKVIVFVFDTGAWDHPDLEPFSWHEKDRIFTGEESNIDLHSHSTHCAGIVAGVDGDGSDPLAAKGFLKVISYKVLQNSGSGMFSWIETAVLEANKEATKLMEDGYFIIYSFSLGGGGSHAGTDRALQHAKNAGVYVVAAAGNTGGEGLHYPGKSEFVHGVGALQKDGTGVKRASYSTYGDEIDVSEPGSGILSTVLDGGYAFKSGTSMATPHQARLGALVASIYPDATAWSVENHLLKFAKDLPPSGWDKYTGYGWNVIDQLLDNEPGSDPPPPPPDPEPDPEPDPPTTKPARIFTAKYPADNTYYEIRYRKSGAATSKILYFRITIEAESKMFMDDFAKQLSNATDKHFRRRSYSMSNDPDFYDAGYWAAYFFDLLEGKKFEKLRVIKMEIVNEAGTPGIIGKDQLKNLEGLSRLFIKGKKEAKKLNSNFFN